MREIVCPECGKDFSEFDYPLVSLATWPYQLHGCGKHAKQWVYYCSWACLQKGKAAREERRKMAREKKQETLEQVRAMLAEGKSISSIKKTCHVGWATIQEEKKKMEESIDMRQFTQSVSDLAESNTFAMNRIVREKPAPVDPDRRPDGTLKPEVLKQRLEERAQRKQNENAVTEPVTEVTEAAEPADTLSESVSEVTEVTEATKETEAEPETDAQESPAPVVRTRRTTVYETDLLTLTVGDGDEYAHLCIVSDLAPIDGETVVEIDKRYLVQIAQELNEIVRLVCGTT